VNCAYCQEQPATGPYDRCGPCRTYRDEAFCAQRGIEHGNVESFLAWCDRTKTDALSSFDITDAEWAQIRAAADPVETCSTCGMVANLDPSLHTERYGHVPTVIRDGVPHVFDFTNYTFQPAQGST
jgi:hypothetical protein